MESEVYLEDMVNTIQRIVPKNWHIIQTGEEMVFKPNAFNILLWVYPMYDEELEDEEYENQAIGLVNGPIRFRPISMWAKISQTARKESKKYGKKLVGQIEMELDENLLGIDTFIHELGHVAAVRWKAQQEGRIHRKEFGIVGQDFDGESDHGPAFQKAYRRIIIRAEKVLGKKQLKHNRADLKMYKERTKEEKKGGNDMAILAECPVCHRKVTIKKKSCKCGSNLDAEKKAKRVVYHIVYRVNGKQVWKALSSFEGVKANSLEDARTVESKFLVCKRENRLEVFNVRPDATMTFKELSEWYLKQPKDRNKSIWRTKIALDKVNASEIGGMIVKEIKNTDLEGYKAKRSESVRPATIDQEIVAAKAVINLAFENDLVSSRTFKVFRSVKKRLKAGSNARKGTISVEQYDALISGCPKHVSLMAATGYHTGMRLGEILNLTWPKVNLKDRFISLDATDTKEALPKRVPISDALQDVLKSVPRAIHDQHVFLYKGSPLSDIRAGLEKGCESAGIEYGRYKDFTFHTLRHTFKTDCRRAGIADHVSEAIMGHSDGNSMSKRYDEVTDQDRLQAIAKLEAYRASVRQNVSFGQNEQVSEAR